MQTAPVNANAAARFDLSGKTAWVSGGAGLLGSAVCRGLAEHGAHVIVADPHRENMGRLVDALNSEGLSAEAMMLDVGDEPAVAAAAQDIVRRRGGIDVLVNMAFYYENTGPWDKLSIESWEKSMRVTLTGAFIIGRTCAQIMKAQRRGSMIQFSSMYGIVSPDPRMYPEGFFPNPIDYGVAKAGVLQMVKYESVMLAPYNVRVNAIIPGSFPRTEGQQTDSEFMKRLSGKSPMGRVGKAPEMAGPVIFLASDASSYVTGTRIVVDGGWTAW